MREIKFRGKSKETNEWLYGSLINNVFSDTNNDKNICYILDISKINYDCWEDILGYLDELEVHPETVGQYICVDDTGQDVYEGDIVKYYEFNEETEELVNMGIGEIYFDDDYELNYTIRGEEPNSLGIYMIKVIGNIHENLNIAPCGKESCENCNDYPCNTHFNTHLI